MAPTPAIRRSAQIIWLYAAAYALIFMPPAMSFAGRNPDIRVPAIIDQVRLSAFLFLSPRRDRAGGRGLRDGLAPRVGFRSLNTSSASHVDAEAPEFGRYGRQHGSRSARRFTETTTAKHSDILPSGRAGEASGFTRITRAGVRWRPRRMRRRGSKEWRRGRGEPAA